MRYDSEHKQRTRRRVVAAAGRAFRKGGIGQTGIVTLMGQVGLTQGGFYAHFPSKDALVIEALLEALNGTRSALIEAASAARAEGRPGIEGIITRYLSLAHMKNPEQGCVLAALGDEIGRLPAEMRRQVAAAGDGLAGIVAGELGEGLRDRAVPILGLMVGTLQIARLLPDEDEAERVLARGRDAALALACLAEPNSKGGSSAKRRPLRSAIRTENSAAPSEAPSRADR